MSAFHQADETRWLVFVAKEAKIGHGWWLWVVGGGGWRYTSSIRRATMRFPRPISPQKPAVFFWLTATPPTKPWLR